MNPLILRVVDSSKVDSIANISHKNGWYFILGFEPDKEKDLTDLEIGLSLAIHHKEVKIGGNIPCPCGIRMKYKKCCGATERPILQFVR